MTKKAQGYRRPTATVISVNAKCVLCQSVNGSMYEEDFGDGGFTEQ